MGKTKTAFVSETEEVKKTSAEKYAEKKAKREAEKEKVLQVPKVEQVLQEETKTETPKQKKEIIEKQRGKKYLEAKSKINKANSYKLTDAIKLIKETSYSKFDGTMEMHLVVKKTGVNVNVTLPFSAENDKHSPNSQDQIGQRKPSRDFKCLPKSKTKNA